MDRDWQNLILLRIADEIKDSFARQAQELIALANIQMRHSRAREKLNADFWRVHEIRYDMSGRFVLSDIGAEPDTD